MNEKPINIVLTDNQSQEIAVPVEPDQLGDFIKSLLGQSQSIERDYKGSFDINHEWLNHIHSLIDQRINQQNHAALSGFKAIIYFDDNVKRTLTTVEAFTHYSETKLLKSIAIRMNWTYLVNFPDKNLPEKQEISLFISSKPDFKDKKDKKSRLSFLETFTRGYISTTIDHTERTWGDDIDNLLKQEIEKKVNKFGNESPYLMWFFLLTGFAILFAGLGLPDYFIYMLQKVQIQSVFADYSTIINYPIQNLEDLNQKINLMLLAVHPENAIVEVNPFYRAISLVVATILAIWCFTLGDRSSPSFLVLTDETKQARDIILKKNKHKYTIQIITWLGAVGAGLLSNYLYFVLTVK